MATGNGSKKKAYLLNQIVNALLVTVHLDKRANLRNGDALLVAERDGLVESKHQIEAFLRHLVLVRRFADVRNLHARHRRKRRPTTRRSDANKLRTSARARAILVLRNESVQRSNSVC